MFDFLKIDNRIGVDLRDKALYSGTFLLDDTLEDFAGKLLTLIMPNVADLNLLLMPEVFMIVHFACNEGISTSLYGSIKKE